MRKLCLAMGILWGLASLPGDASPAAAQGPFSEVASPSGDTEQVVTVSAAFSADKKTRTGELSITAEVADGWHIYSITQASGGPVRTKIKLGKNAGFKLTGDFEPAEPPKTHVDEKAYKDLTLEEHEGSVTWTAPIELAAGIDPAQLKITGKLFAQSCSGANCNLPQDFPFTASYAPPAAVAKPATAEPADREEAGVYEAGDITFRGYITPRMMVPGGKFKLVIAAEPAPGWHIYELSAKAPASAIGARPTLLVLTEASGLKNGPAVASEPAVSDEISSVRIHEEPVTWTVELIAPPAAKRGPIKIEGLLGYQICTAKSCQNPSALGFAANVTIGSQTVEGRVPLKFDAKRKYNEAQKLVKDSNAAAGDNNRGAGGDKTSSLKLDQLKP
ncbi:MAG: protein-disulfide reductase DsbD domain-containing protein, partial [Pirellulales bacterium]